MIRQSGMVVWILLAGGAPLAGAAGARAATSATLDILPDEAERQTGNSIDVGGVKPLPKPAREAKPLPSGNPLWAVPLSALSATRERPIFSASRRPPQAAVVAPVAEQANPPAAAKSPPARPPLALIGAVVGEGDAIAVLMDQTSQKIVRLRRGESHGGWELSSVQPREVTLKQAERTEILSLKPADGAAGGPPALPGAPKMVYPTAGNASFAPFMPRSTPKNGESDGL